MIKGRKRLWLQSLMASAVAVGLSLFGYALTNSGLHSGVFLLVPVCTGMAIAVMSRGRMVVGITAMTSLLLSLSTLLWAGVEGVGCVLLAFPLLFVGIGVGASIGYIFCNAFDSRYGSPLMVALCLGLMTFVGWKFPDMADPEELVVETGADFYAPMEDVWEVVREPAPLDGDERLLRFLNLPVPRSCSMTGDGSRVCYFDEGQMRQRVTDETYGKRFAVEIVESLEVRDWLEFIDASYVFQQQDGFVRVTRRDQIRSRLRPRWYWPWFEARCVRLEHDYVMGSMKRQVEQ